MTINHFRIDFEAHSQEINCKPGQKPMLGRSSTLGQKGKLFLYRCFAKCVNKVSSYLPWIYLYAIDYCCSQSWSESLRSTVSNRKILQTNACSVWDTHIIPSGSRNIPEEGIKRTLSRRMGSTVKCCLLYVTWLTHLWTHGSSDYPHIHDRPSAFHHGWGRGS